ncbi:MAG: TolC family protein [Armatimonadetes bacterium]|nr:TolC family protein [Armatimonadota bacterium]
MNLCHLLKGAIAAVLWAVVLVSPAAAEDLSLSRAVDLALGRHPSLAAKKLSAESARHAARGARALVNPEIAVGPTLFGESGTEAFISASQPLELNGSRKVRGNIAVSEAAAAEYEAEAARHEIERDVKLAYWEVVQAQEMVRLSQENLSGLETLRAAVQKQYDAGAVPGSQIIKSDLELARARQERTQAELTLTQGKTALNALMNRPISTEFTPSDLLAYREMPLNPSTLEQKALAARPEIASTMSLLEAARHKVRAARLLTAPDIAVQARQETSDAEGGVGVAIILPLLDWGAVRAERKRAETAARSQEKESEAARNDVVLDVAKAVQAVEASQSVLREFQEGILEKSERLTEMTQKGYERGASGFLEVLEARRTLRSTRAEYAAALASYQKAIAWLEWASGIPMSRSVSKEEKP